MKSIKSSVRLLIAVCTLLSCNQKLSGMAVAAPVMNPWGYAIAGGAVVCGGCAGYYFYKTRISDVGIAPETIVKGVGKSFFIGDVRPLYQIFSCDKELISCKSLVRSTREKRIPRLIQITVEDELILVAPGQVFLCLRAGWVSARDLKPGDQLMCCGAGSVEIDDIKVIDGETTVCSLALDNEYGFYFISRYEILTYNFTLQKIWGPTKWMLDRVAVPILVGVATIWIGSKIPNSNPSQSKQPEPQRL